MDILETLRAICSSASPPSPWRSCPNIKWENPFVQLLNSVSSPPTYYLKDIVWFHLHLSIRQLKTATRLPWSILILWLNKLIADSCSGPHQDLQSFSAKLIPTQSASRTSCWGYSVPSATLLSVFIELYFCQPISTACWCFTEKYSYLQAYQSLAQARYHLQRCWAFTLGNH